VQVAVILVDFGERFDLYKALFQDIMVFMGVGVQIVFQNRAI
jgi:hypothetical protein